VKLVEIDLQRIDRFFEADGKLPPIPWDERHQFLCRNRHGRFFVSDVCLLEDPLKSSMPSNCRSGCLYVDHGEAGLCIPIDDLSELCLIKVD